mgnify:CR=1 FL=1
MLGVQDSDDIYCLACKVNYVKGNIAQGGAIYNNDSTNSFTNCYFALDTADCGTSDAIYSPSKVTNSHFYNDDPFEKDWSNYYDKTGLVDASSTNNVNGSFLEVVKGEEIVSGKYYLIKNEKKDLKCDLKQIN